MTDIVDLLKLILTAIWNGVQIGWKKPAVIKYRWALAKLFALAVSFPAITVCLGIYWRLDWVVSLAGLWSALWLLVLFVWATPVGVVVEAILGGWGNWWGSGARWVSRCRGILLAELIITFVLSIIPVQNNPKLVPLCLLSGVLIYVASVHWQIKSEKAKQILFRLAIIVFVLTLLSFFFPNSFRATAHKVSGLDQGTATFITNVWTTNSTHHAEHRASEGSFWEDLKDSWKGTERRDAWVGSWSEPSVDTYMKHFLLHYDGPVYIKTNDVVVRDDRGNPRIFASFEQPSLGNTIHRLAFESATNHIVKVKIEKKDAWP